MSAVRPAALSYTAGMAGSARLNGKLETFAIVQVGACQWLIVADGYAILPEVSHAGGAL